MAGATSYAFSGGGKWRWYQEGGRNVPIDEIKHHGQEIRVKDGLIASRDFLALISEKLKGAERGELVVPSDGRPYLVRARGVMEIKWGVGRTQWRLYYCEPLRLRAERVMLALLFNRKDSAAQQDIDIEEAGRRWRWWQAQSHG